MFLDTSGLFCVFHQDEVQHGEAERLFRVARARLTHSYVLAEFVALCQARRLNRAASLAFARATLDNPTLEIVWVSQDMHRVALTYLQSRLDKSYSLCDAVSFLLMYERGMVEALTTDHHFDQAGLRRLLI
ncbi:MAG: type II toxin-antitoxin system VapC family toxin [Anaerolineae bacterium]|nr:type II toxin-antitoxin system VapC family toxin [Anaerolineae bacterium]